MRSRRLPAGRGRHGKRLPQDFGFPDLFTNLGFPQPVTTGASPTQGSAVGNTGQQQGGQQQGGLQSTVTDTGVANNPAETTTSPIVTVTIVHGAGGQILSTIGLSSTSSQNATTSTSSSVSSTLAITSSSIPPLSVVASVTPSSSAPSASSTNQQDASNKSTGTTADDKGVPLAAIAGILIFVVIALVLAVVFFIRNRQMKKRRERRNTFSAGISNMFPKSAEDAPAVTGNTNYTSAAYASSYLSEKPLTPPPVNTNFAPPSIPATLRPGYSSPVASRPPQALYGIASPPITYNNAATYNAPTTIAYSSPVISPPPVATGAVASASNAAMVRCTYLPRLPDELSISTGERILVLTDYDDGWALCMNERGEQGVVPLECLDRSADASGSEAYVQEGGVRNMQRASSLRRV